MHPRSHSRLQGFLPQPSTTKEGGQTSNRETSFILKDSMVRVIDQADRQNAENVSTSVLFLARELIDTSQFTTSFKL